MLHLNAFLFFNEPLHSESLTINQLHQSKPSRPSKAQEITPKHAKVLETLSSEPLMSNAECGTGFVVQVPAVACVRVVGLEALGVGVQVCS